MSTSTHVNTVSRLLKVPQCFNVIHDIITSDVLEMLSLKLIDLNIWETV